VKRKKGVHNNNNRHFNTWANPELKLLKEREGEKLNYSNEIEFI
jgi:hypothetical protein